MTDKEKKGPAAKRRTTRKPAPAGKKAGAPKAKPAEGKGENTILEAALIAFARDGFDGASLPSIARAAKIGHPLIHYHFGSKENLWRAAIEYAFSQLRESFSALEEAARDLKPADRLRMLIRAFVQFGARYPHHATILFAEGRADRERFTWLIDNYLAPLHRVIDRTIEQAIAQKEIKPIPAVHLTTQIIGSTVVFFGASQFAQALYGVDVRDKAAADAHAEWLIETIFKGILA